MSKVTLKLKIADYPSLKCAYSQVLFYRHAILYFFGAKKENSAILNGIKCQTDAEYKILRFKA